MSSKRPILLVIIALLLSMILVVSSGCAAGPTSGGTPTTAATSGPTELKDKNVSFLYWSGSEPGNKFKSEIKAFEDAFGATVKVDNVSWSEWSTKFVVSMATGDAYDIAPLMEYYFPNWALKDVVQPIDGYLDVKDPLWNQSVIDRYTIQGKTYGVGTGYGPLEADAYYVFYNKTLFEDNGLDLPLDLYKQGKWDFAAFRSAAKTLTQDTDGDGVPNQYGYATYVFDQWATANGGTLVNYNADGTITSNLKDPKVLSAIQTQADMVINDKAMPANAGTTWATGFIDGSIAMICERSYVAQWYDFKSKIKFGWDLVPFPFGPDNTDKTFVGDIQGMGITVGAKNPEGAAAFIKFVSKWSLDNSDSLYADAYTTDQVAMMKTVRGKLVSSKTYGIGRWAMQYMGMLGSLFDPSQGFTAATVVEQFEPKLIAEIDACLKDTSKYDIEKFKPVPKIDFEGGSIEGSKDHEKISVKDLVLTKDAAEAIEGTSMKIVVDPETIATWTFHYATDFTKYHLPAYSSLKVSFDVKFLSDSLEDGFVYAQVISKDGLQTNGWLGTDPGARVGDLVHVEGAITLAAGPNDNTLFIGGYNVGDYVIDNIVIEAA